MKKNNKKIYIFLEVVFLFLLPTIGFFVGIFKLESTPQIVLSTIYATWIISISIYWTILYRRHLNNILIAENSVNYYIEREVNENGMGLIVFRHKGTIVWISKLVEQKLGRNIVGKNIKDIFQVSEWSTENLDFNIEKEKNKYEVHISLERNIAIIKDITVQENLLRDYEKQRVVLGEINIDNILLYQSTMSEEEIFKIYSSVVKLLDELANEYDLIYRQYENGRFFIITNKDVLDQWENHQFNFFDKLKHKGLTKELNITVSAGFAYGILNLDVLDKLAKEAMLQSQARGGDQISVVTKNEKMRHYGSTTEIDVNISRTNVNYIANVLINKLKSKKIQNVVIYGHKNADLDALGSAYAVYKLAKAYKKNAFIQNITFDETTSRLLKTHYTNLEEIFISPKQALALNNEQTLVILVDTSDEDRIENKEAFTNILIENIVVLDHHRISKTPDYAYKNNTYIDSSASSASEIVTEIIALTNNGDKIDQTTAQLLLDGIYLDTNRFQKQTSSKTFHACSLLHNWGATTNASVDSLKIAEGVYKTISMLLQNLQEVKPGYYLAYGDFEVPIDIISITADEILRVQGRKAAFVIAKLPDSKKYKMSARGIDTNVQIIAEAVNGGGHYAAAAAETEESLELFVDNLKQAIVSVKNESNLN
ncbi:Bifunctional oligoribonuclease and PAP phosphatase nrnA [Metamycoplasma cloacale]|uniref:Uncharacterized protein n=1 Tax=Metamycoplasma cloacale TaxID=92401 RepID=A0A2Z4LL99_9BACT|nr:DHH family phosphoesterase [Metamycoplasma cloacale]AWX42510.1 hypothetical protein DK849_00200 [Metamycoplasma cloacale]VEU79144.1 Bifunctional oligoribonuclease and PAP phosphatase nrnA [Metamycoplasma cloacale]